MRIQANMAAFVLYKFILGNVRAEIELGDLVIERSVILGEIDFVSAKPT